MITKFAGVGRKFLNLQSERINYAKVFLYRIGPKYFLKISNEFFLSFVRVEMFSNEKKKKAFSTFFFSVLFSFWPNVRTALPCTLLQPNMLNAHDEQQTFVRTTHIVFSRQDILSNSSF